jgi:tetratricopeptide (TPR) repeat protein
MKYRIAALVEGIILCVLVLAIIFSGLRTLSNWRAAGVATQGLDLAHLKKYEQAKEKFQAAVAARPDYLPGLQALLHLNLYGKTPNEKAVTDTADRLLSLTGGKGQRAAAAYLALGALKARKAEEQADAAQRIEVLKAAEAEFRKATEADDKCAEALVNRGILSYLLFRETNDNRDLAAAGVFLDQAKKSTSISIHALYPLAATCGQILFAQGRHMTALEELRIAMELDPTQSEGLTNLAIAYAQRLTAPGITLEAKAAMLQEVESLVTEDNPAYFVLQSAIGTAYFDLGRYGDSTNIFTRLATKFEKEGSAVGNVAASEYARLKRAVNPKPAEPIAAAVDALTVALSRELSPRNRAKCLNLMGLCIQEGYPFRSTQNPKKVYSSEYYLREAVRLDTTFWAASRNLGIMHQRANEWKEALNCYRMSLEAKKTQVDVDRAVKKFESPPQIMSPPEYASAMTVILGKRGITKEKFPAMLIGVQPSYPGKVEKDLTRILIDGQLQLFWVFITNNDIVIVAKDPLEDGLHQLEATFVDAGGNSRALQWAFVVDLNDPVISYRHPEPEATVHPDTVFTLQMEDSSGIDYKTVEIGVGRSGAAAAAAKIISAGEYQYDMREAKKFRKDNVDAARIQFMLPKATATGAIFISVKFNDNSGRTCENNKWDLKLVLPQPGE